MESPAAFPDTPVEHDDVIFHCKGCGDILEEGKAFELAGNRWHIDCFRCNTCDSALDSDANLLMLGDGSLICNNCTYSCCACGNKIEDLAILTGDQAFCGNCFRCRNCKRKIENLRYARTSQGIFCMNCHESLMARRRKKAKMAKQNTASSLANSPMLLDKSLPSLPPSAIPPNAFTPDPSLLESPPERRDRSPQPRRSSATGSERREIQRDRSPATIREASKETLTLPPTTYKEERRSRASPQAESPTGDDGFFIPLALDESVASPSSAVSKPKTGVPVSPDQLDARLSDAKSLGRDIYPQSRSSSLGSQQPQQPQPQQQQQQQQQQQPQDSRPVSSRSLSVPKERQNRASSYTGASPHIAFQGKDRQPSNELVETMRKRKEILPAPTPNATNQSPVAGGSDKLSQTQSATSSSPHTAASNLQLPESISSRVSSRASSPAHSERFKLQDVPQSKKAGGSARAVDTSRSPSIIDRASSESAQKKMEEPPRRREPPRSAYGHDGAETPRTSEETKKKHDTPSLSGHSSPFMRPSEESPRPPREESMGAVPQRHSISRKEVPDRGAFKPSVSSTPDHHRPSTPPQAPPPPPPGFMGSPNNLVQLNGGRTISAPMESPDARSMHDPSLPARVEVRPSSARPSQSDTFTMPRSPPRPPTSRHKTRNSSISTAQSESSRNGDVPVGLPRYSGHGEFSMDEDMARIWGADEQENPTSMLRRISKTVRHGRSFSDKGLRLSNSPKWPKSPLNSIAAGHPHDIGSPSSASPDARDENVWLRGELRQAQQRIAELEAESNVLKIQVNGTADINQVNTELREKRSTVAILDTQKEVIVRELEVMADHIAKAKHSDRPFDVGELKSGVLQDLALSMRKLKETFTSDIEELVQRKHQLTDEITNLTSAKEKSIQEFEQLTLKNAQLAELNNQLVHNIQGLYKANRDPSADNLRPSNGLGIYTHHHKEKSETSMDLRPSTADNSLTASQTTLQPEHDVEPATVLSTPQVVNIRKGQPKKFNWKRGGHTVAKGVSKGFKGAFLSSSQQQQQMQREGHLTEGLPYGMLTPGAEPTIGGTRSQADTGRQPFGFFGNQKQGTNKAGQWKGTNNGSGNFSTTPSDDGSNLFGTELELRTQFEKREIPSIVIRCIEEVELRGMDVEGIYRKSGGAGQVKLVVEGFEKSEDFDLSDPDLDIHAVTSALKQYFHKLPTPLITYDVYDLLLDSNRISDVEKRMIAMRSALDELPRSHGDTLEFLIFHLARVLDRVDENKMPPLNLAVVFAPTIMRPLSIEREMTDIQAKQDAVRFLIEHNKAIFMHDQLDI
ncbi:RhoGAP-domain-containing protein [Xylona heveae TC161]|uniref:RhoGAP-domain-containing protein n=1 Tax=Xylona heveae (strain CBS 132557 / TC161) TaxID=1328760 RepID=A0A165HEM2_XYLHT|nr:RhoGAP-domain-containing protein [Xylona heveae TC161]KZF23394.1 RhoGAP-domain-containing protein [Xylona heveae TC161]